MISQQNEINCMYNVFDKLNMYVSMCMYARNEYLFCKYIVMFEYLYKRNGDERPSIQSVCIRNDNLRFVILSQIT